MTGDCNYAENVIQTNLEQSLLSDSNGLTHIGEK